jgi:cytochrome c oxidase subunit 3
MAAAVALGVLFLAGQAAAWRTLIEAGVYLPSSPHSSFFFMMTGAHALHVAAALCVLGWGGVKTWRGEGRRDPRAWRMTMSVCRTFWHFLLLVWLYVFGVITLL